LTRPLAVVVALHDPYMRSHGGTLRTRALVEATARLCDVVVVCPGGADASRAITPRIRTEVFAGAPAGQRLAPSGLGRAKRALFPVPFATGARSAARAAVLARVGPARVVAVSQLYLQPAVHDVDHDHVWIDHSDLLSAFARSYAERRRAPGTVTAAAQAVYLAHRERVTGRRAGVLSCAGLDEAGLLARRLGRDVAWLPTPVRAPATVTPPPRTGALGLLANFHFDPNRRAYRELVRTWLPRWGGRHRVVVAGYGSEDLPAADGVALLGPVDRVEDFYAAVDATVAPIDVGGGMKVKVVESLLHGRPVYASGFAARGLPAEAARCCRPLAALAGLRTVPALDPRDVGPVGDLFGFERFAREVERRLRPLL
jgi:polysaccharide biosynthesis protein PslH